MLPADSDALLAVDRPPVLRRRLSEEDGLELVHAGVDKGQRRVIEGDDAARRDKLVGALDDKEVDELLSDLPGSGGLAGWRRGTAVESGNVRHRPVVPSNITEAKHFPTTITSDLVRIFDSTLQQYLHGENNDQLHMSNSLLNAQYQQYNRIEETNQITWLGKFKVSAASCLLEADDRKHIFPI